MQIAWLDGLRDADPAAAMTRAAIERDIAARGWNVERFALPELDIAPCAGDFKCWTDHPGTCVIQDANRDIARAMMHADVLLMSTAITFGGYSSELKKAVDHLVQNISPRFTRVGGETHHVPRYPSYPHLVVVGTIADPDEDSYVIFNTLVTRNAINMYAPSARAIVVHETEPEARVAAAIADAFSQAGAAA
jgi:multimeric flavodoxin WrbA